MSSLTNRSATGAIKSEVRDVIDSGNPVGHNDGLTAIGKASGVVRRMPPPPTRPSLRPSKRCVIVIDDDESATDQPAEKSAKREEETDPTLQVLQLQQELAKSKHMYQRAVRAAGEYKYRAEKAEERLDSKYGIKSVACPVVDPHDYTKRNGAAADEQQSVQQPQQHSLKLLKRPATAAAAAATPHQPRAAAATIADLTRAVDDEDEELRMTKACGPGGGQQSDGAAAPAADEELQQSQPREERRQQQQKKQQAAAAQCILCETTPRTAYAYAQHLYLKHRSTLVANGIYLQCSCGDVYNFMKHKKGHSDRCDGLQYSLHSR